LGFASRAVQDLKAADWDAFALHAGTSLELLAKSFLCTLHPSLIMSDLLSTLYACDVPGHTAMPQALVRTIGFREAMNRSGRVLPTISNLTHGNLDHLIAARNSVAHFGGSDSVTRERAISAYLVAMQELFRGMELDPYSAWGDAADYVRNFLAKVSQDMQARVKEQLEAAQRHRATRFQGLDGEQVKVAIASIEASYRLEAGESELIDCPACSCKATAGGTADVDWEGEAEYEGPGEFSYNAVPIVTFYAAELRCRVCGLALDGADELEAAGLDTTWTLDDADPADYFEPDWSDFDDF